MRPRKLRHRPSDELIDIRERGLPWLFSVFVVLFLLLTILLFYFILTTRNIYLSQRKELEDVKREEAAAQKQTVSDEETWKAEEEEEEEEEEREMMRRRKGKKEKEKEKVHVDIVPIVNRKTGEPDKVIELTSTSTTQEPTTTIPTTTSTTTTTTTSTTEEPTTTTLPLTSTDAPIEEEEEEQFPTIETPRQEMEGSDEEEKEEEEEEVMVELDDDNIDDVQVEEYEGTTTTTTVTPPPARNYTKIEWEERRAPKSQSETFSKFAIITHHEECSGIGRKVFESGGNAIDATIAAEFCISAVHPHSTGPGFGAVMLVHSRAKNETFVIDGRERAPKNANQNTFVINPTIAHIGYSSMGVPGWISTLWSAHKQFGSGRIPWKQLIEPTLARFQNGGVRVDRQLAQAFEARKNQILHEKSFANWLNTSTAREGAMLRNEEYEQFLGRLKESVHAEHDFYGGEFSKSIVEEMKSRGGLMSRHDLEAYKSTVSKAESLRIGEWSLEGPPLPYHFPILEKVLKNITESFDTNPKDALEYYVNFVQLLQQANQMKALVGDDLFDVTSRQKIEEWKKQADTLKPEEQKRSQVPFSRIQALDESGNAVNFMSTNSVPWGSVRRSPTMGFVWNNAMSAFDVFCRHDVNCVQGGKRPSVTNGFPSILVNSQRQLLISPTSNALETTAALVAQSTLMKMTPSESLDHPRILPQSADQVLVEPGVPPDLYRTLWTHFRAQFTHPAAPISLIESRSGSMEALCDFRTRNCYPSGT
ncbi:unnamed protein product [Caenorhabditis sp. 36 PRJEB53466]|nr:unnamed protein product [Caenorhabditis sp. 36 PRJEB53466]